MQEFQIRYQDQTSGLPHVAIIFDPADPNLRDVIHAITDVFFGANRPEEVTKCDQAIKDLREKNIL